LTLFRIECTLAPLLTEVGRMRRSSVGCSRLAGAWLLACALMALPAFASAQGASSARQLEAEATLAFESGIPARCIQAAKLWLSAADQYTTYSWTADAASALRNASRAYSCAGKEEVALGYLGRAAELDNAVASYRALVLLDRSPLFDPASRDMTGDARFVGAVNDLLHAVGPDEAVRVTSAEEAQAALENLVSLRLAPITVRAESGAVSVELRRYRYAIGDSTRGGAQWERVSTDVTLKRIPAAYHFRYRSPSTGRDTTLLYRCADGCTVLVR
jgi:hypothetical protein